MVLPNAWDVPSARVFEDEGFPAVATSSAGMMVSLGYPDGEEIPAREFFSAVGRIARVLSIPLSADLMGGFGGTPEGVARVSFGPSASYAAMGLLKRASWEVRQKGNYDTLLEGAITFDELNALALPRKWPKPRP